jgi:hypothetical protein|tara:strand:+ start:82 stop:249 length:168 start_codon:yes stop_codon:yes gene_type:complete
MTYKELLDMLGQLDDEQLDFQVMAYVDEEFYKATELNIHEKEDRLKDGHPYIEIE